MYDAILKEKSSDFSDLKSCALFNLVKKNVNNRKSDLILIGFDVQR